MTAVAVDEQQASPSETDAPPAGVTALMAVTMVVTMLQTAASLATLYPLTSGAGRIAILALHAALLVTPVLLGAWAWQTLRGDGTGAARPFGHFLRLCLYVLVVTSLASLGLESRFLHHSLLIWLSWAIRIPLGFVLTAACFVRLTRGKDCVARYGRSVAGQIADVQMLALTRDAAIVILLMIASLVFVLTRAALPSIRTFGWSFLVTSDWRPNPLPGGPKLDKNGDAVTDPDTGETVMNPDIPPVFGVLPLIWGTVASSAIALVFAVPLSFGAALFLVRVAPEVRPTMVLSVAVGLCVTAILNHFLSAFLIERFHIPDAPAMVVSLFLGLILTGAVTSLVAQNVQPNVTPKQTIFLIEAGSCFLIGLGASILLVIAGLGLLGSILFGYAAAVGLWLLSPIMAASISFLIEFLAAIPSIAYGIWGIFVLAPFLQIHFEPAIQAVYHVLPDTGWDHLVLILCIPLLGFIVSWAAYRFAPPTVSKCAITTVWLAMFAMGVASSVIGVRMAYARTPVLASFDDAIDKHTSLRPTLDWLFIDKVKIDGKEEARTVALTGNDMLCGGLVLAIMIIPIITAISRDVLRTVPRAQVEGTTALGGTWWQSSKEMLKFSRSALFGAVILGLARAAGETMAVTMVIGNNPQIKLSPFMAAQTMASLLANQFGDASDVQRSALFEVALILLAMSLAFNVIARYLVVGKGSRTAAAH